MSVCRGKAAQPPAFACAFCVPSDFIQKGRITVNQFSELSSIFGAAEAKPPTLQEFFSQAGNIRVRLGGQKNLFDRYLSNLFQVLNQKFVYDAASEGFSAASELNSMCVGILSENPKHTDYPFYQRLREYIHAHPLSNWEDYTKIHLYCSMLHDEFMKDATGRFFTGLTEGSQLCVTMQESRRLYENICARLGGEGEMEQLNRLFGQRFLLASVMDTFRQGITDQLVCSLSSRDRQTSKQIFELLLDSGEGKE